MTQPLFAITVTVDAAANRHPIDPRIYGLAWADTAQLTDMGATLNRWGGNAMSRYNWIYSTANRAKDYYFENIPDNVSSGDGSNGKSADDFIAATKAAGAEPVMTIPMMGILPKDRSIRCGYLISKYGEQDDRDWEWRPDCGNGKQGGQRMLHVNDPADTSAIYPSSHQVDWVEHLMATWGSAANGGVRYYSLDNEPGLWSFDHWDVHPDGSTYDEVWEKMAEYGAAIRATEPNAVITGIEEWGWTGYFISGMDHETGDGADRAAHGGVNYAEWLLQQAAAHEEETGTRILDVAALHYYPQDGEFSNDTSTAMQEKRNRSTRSLWDPAYVDESWIGDGLVEGGIVNLIPRLRGWVATNYPGTLTGITEYNWGAEGHINGATAQADILGIFGRERLDLATRWTTPALQSPVANAFKMYRNYDGSHSTFGDLTVSTTAPSPDNVSAFASLRSSDRKMTVMIVAKQLSGSTPVTVTLANYTPSGAAQRWQLDATNSIAHLSDVALSSGTYTLTVPAQSITLLVVPGSYLDAPTNVIATATSTTTAGVSWSAVSGATSYKIFRSSNHGAFTQVGTSAGTTFNDTPLSANTTYLYKVQAVVGAVTSPLSNVDAATTVMFTNDPLTTSVPIKTAHATELRTAVNAMRTAAGLPSVAFVGGSKVLAVHVTELREALDEARAEIGLPPLTYTDTITAGVTKVKAVHWNELRTGVK